MEKKKKEEFNKDFGSATPLMIAKILIITLLIMASLIVSVSLIGHVPAKNVSENNQTWAAFFISPSNNSISSDVDILHLVYLKLWPNGKCGYILNGEYISTLPYNFTVYETVIHQNTWIPENMDLNGYPLFVTVDTKGSTLFCNVAVLTDGTMPNTKSYTDNGTWVIS